MLCIVNAAVPPAILKALEKIASVIPFRTEGITYPAISNHPDVFFCKVGGTIIFAPNTPPEYITGLDKAGVTLKAGRRNVDGKYPYSAVYNAAVDESYIIHNNEITDRVLAEECAGLRFINVRQGYSRCSVLALPGGSFITSDPGINKALIQHGLQCMFTGCGGIQLPGFKTGFFGGTSAVINNTVYFMGSLKYYDDGPAVNLFLQQRNIDTVYLNDAPLFDGGSILFI